jgi:hypothetical protein
VLVSDLARFGVFIVAAFLLFLGVVYCVVRRRTTKPRPRAMLALATVVVPIGMLFARYSHIFFHDLPWEIYYGVPALTTFLLPPLWLRMRRGEIASYVPLAVLMAPAIHVVFSLLVGWHGHDYMPFPVYLPSLAEILRGATR